MIVRSLEHVIVQLLLVLALVVADVPYKPSKKIHKSQSWPNTNSEEKTEGTALPASS